MSIIAVALALSLRADDPSAWDVYEEGRAAEKAGHMASAYLLYSRAAAIDPENRMYWLRSQAVRSRAMLEAKTMPQPAPGGDGASEEPDDAQLPPATIQDRIAARKRQSPSELAGTPMKKNFDLKGDSKKLFEGVAHAFGLDCVFDGDYQASPTARFQVNEMDYREALHALETMTGTFVVPLSDKLFLVAKDTPQKRSQVEPSVTVLVRLPDATSAQEFTGIITAVQQAMALEKVGLDAKDYTVILKGPLSKVRPAQALIEDLLQPKPQVEVELRFLEVSRNDVITYGLSLPKMLSLTPLTDWLNNKVSLPSGITGLLAFGGGKTLMGIGIMDPSLVATMSKSSGTLLLDTQLRSVDGQAATLHIGDRYPVLTSGYYGPASFSGPGAYTPPPSFTFEDLGLTLKVTSRTHPNDDVSMEIDAQFRLLAGQMVSGIPVVSNRSLKSAARLRAGEWAAVAGLLTTNEARTITGIAGLSHVPYLGALTSQHGHNTSTDQVLILIRPHVVNRPSGELAPHTYYVGSETRPLTRL